MSLEEQLFSISYLDWGVYRQAILAIQSKDTDCTRVFGSRLHRYRINPCKTNDEIQFIEEQINTIFPEEYRSYLLHFSNGGVGPGYGILPLETALNHPEHNPQYDFHSPFPHNQAWNDISNTYDGDSSEYQEWEKQYFSTEWVKGALPIGDYGCGITVLLVLSGPERGNLWIDDRGSDGGIYPIIPPFKSDKDRIGFWEWNIDWLLPLF